MAKQKQVKKAVIKKGWVPIFAPKVFREQEVGESYVADAQSLVGKQLTVNLMTLLRDPKKQGMNVTFEIVGKKGNGMRSELVAFRMIPASLKRMVRRGRNKIDDSFIATTKDGIRLRIKPFLQTRTKSMKSVQTNLRKTAQDFVMQSLQDMSYVEFSRDLIARTFQRKLFDVLKKIYPLATCEIRWMHVLDEGSKVASAVDTSWTEEPKEERREAPAEERPHRVRKEHKEAPAEKPAPPAPAEKPAEPAESSEGTA